MFWTFGDQAALDNATWAAERVTAGELPSSTAARTATAANRRVAAAAHRGALFANATGRANDAVNVGFARARRYIPGA